MDINNPLIIVIDDSSTMRSLIINTLKYLGYKNLESIKDGKEALEFFKKFPKAKKINLIICDWKMPIVSGLDVLNTIRKDMVFKTVPFIMLTSVKNKNNVLEAINQGVSDYIVKPFTQESLQISINRVLKI